MPGAYPCGQAVECFAEAILVVVDEETAHAAVDPAQLKIVAQRETLLAQIFRDRAAQHDARAQGQIVQAGREQIAAHVVEVEIESVRTQLRDPRTGILVLVVNGLLATQVADETAFLRPSRDADHPATQDLEHLDHDRSHSSGRAGHDRQVARLRPAAVQQAPIRAYPRHAEHARAQCVGQAVVLALEEPLLWGCRGDLEGLPAELSLHDVAGAIVRVVGFNHLGHATAVNDIASGQWGFSRGIQALHIHAHHRRQPQVAGLQKHLAGTGHGNRPFRQLEIAGPHVSLRPRRNSPLQVDVLSQSAVPSFRAATILDRALARARPGAWRPCAACCRKHTGCYLARRERILSPEHENRAMRLNVDKKADALYVRLDDSPIVESEEVLPGVVLDYNPSNEVVGVEMLRSSKHSSELNLSALQFKTA